MKAGGGVSFGLGANKLGPVGFRLFWVGATGGGGAVAAAEVVGAIVVVVVVVVVAVVGLLVALSPQAAVSPPIAISATAPV
jgi:hypothetical protein